MANRKLPKRRKPYGTKFSGKRGPLTPEHKKKISEGLKRFYKGGKHSDSRKERTNKAYTPRRGGGTFPNKAGTPRRGGGTFQSMYRREHRLGNLRFKGGSMVHLAALPFKKSRTKRHNKRRKHYM